MPIDPSIDFDYHTQQAYFLFTTLPDKIEGMSGSWLGKEFAGLIDIMNIYEIDNKKEVLHYLLYMIQIAKFVYAEERDLRSKKGIAL